MKISSTGYWESGEKLYHSCCVELCDWIIDYLKDQKQKTTYDFGCGNGQYLKRLHDAGFQNITGFEGSIPVHKEHYNIKQQDLTVPFTLLEKGNCIFLEVAEHVPAQFEDTLLTNVANACDDKMIMSWAVRGQAGWGHVNCLNNDEAIQRLTNKGFTFLPEETKSARAAIPANTICPWFINTTLVFKKS